VKANPAALPIASIDLEHGVHVIAIPNDEEHAKESEAPPEEGLVESREKGGFTDALFQQKESYALISKSWSGGG
jgi:hypothetical protein